MTILNDYFPTDLANVIDITANVRPIIKYNLWTDCIYVLKTTGEVIVQDIGDEEYVSLTNLPKITCFDWTYSGVMVMITTDAKVMQMKDETAVSISQLEEYDVIKISVHAHMFYVLTVTGQLFSFMWNEKDAELQEHSDTSVVQIYDNLALNSQGQVYNLTDASDDFYKIDSFVIKLLSSVTFLSLDGIYVDFPARKVARKVNDIIQYVMIDNYSFEFYLTKKGTIFVNEATSVIPDLNDVSNFVVVNDNIYTIDIDDNIKTIGYETKMSLFVKRRETTGKFIFIAHESLDS